MASTQGVSLDAAVAAPSHASSSGMLSIHANSSVMLRFYGCVYKSLQGSGMTAGLSHTSPISSSSAVSTQGLSPAGFDTAGGGTAATAVATHSAAAKPAASAVATPSAAAQTAATQDAGNSSEDSSSGLQKASLGLLSCKQAPVMMPTYNITVSLFSTPGY